MLISSKASHSTDNVWFLQHAKSKALPHKCGHAYLVNHWCTTWVLKANASSSSWGRTSNPQKAFHVTVPTRCWHKGSKCTFPYQCSCNTQTHTWTCTQSFSYERIRKLNHYIMHAFKYTSVHTWWIWCTSRRHYLQEINIIIFNICCDAT